MFYEVDKRRSIEPEGFEKREHIDRIPAHRRIDIPHAPLSKESKEPFRQSLANTDPHLTGMDPDDLDPAALLQPKSLTLNLSDDEANDLSSLGDRKADPIPFLEVILYHLNPFPGDLPF